MSQVVPLNEQIAVLERFIMDRPWNGDDLASLGATLKLLRLVQRYEAPVRRLLMFCATEVAKAELDPATMNVLAAFPDAKVTLTVRG